MVLGGIVLALKLHAEAELEVVVFVTFWNE